MYQATRRPPGRQPFILFCLIYQAHEMHFFIVIFVTVCTKNIFSIFYRYVIFVNANICLSHFPAKGGADEILDSNV